MWGERFFYQFIYNVFTNEPRLIIKLPSNESHPYTKTPEFGHAFQNFRKPNIL